MRRSGVSWSRQVHHCERLKICVAVCCRCVFRHFTWHTSFSPQFWSADQGERWNVMKYVTTTSSYQGWPARRASRTSFLRGNWGNARASINYDIFPVSWACIATCYGLDRPGLNSGEGAIFRTRSHWSWIPPSLLYNWYRVHSRGNAAGAWRWPPTPSSAEVEERVDLYLFSPSVTLWQVVDWTFPLVWWLVICVHPTESPVVSTSFKTFALRRQRRVHVRKIPEYCLYGQFARAALWPFLQGTVRNEIHILLDSVRTV